MRKNLKEETFSSHFGLGNVVISKGAIFDPSYCSIDNFSTLSYFSLERKDPNIPSIAELGKAFMKYCEYFGPGGVRSKSTPGRKRISARQFSKAES